jgi:hypothetical protein
VEAGRVTLSMDRDGRLDDESILTVIRASSHLALRIEYLRGCLRDIDHKLNRKVRKRLRVTLEAYKALDKLVELDNEDQNDRPQEAVR